MKKFLAVGLMSGTSLDGLDAVLIEARPTRDTFATRTLAHVFRPYPRGVADHVRRVAKKDSLRDAYYFGAFWSEFAAGAVAKLLRKAKVRSNKVDVIGAHGQTVVHLPTPKSLFGSNVSITIQLADLSRLAVRVGIPVVGNFRTGDLAVGGQGAPLAPHAHRLLFSKKGRTVAVQNLGGIGNVTLLDGNHVELAFDTGPANIWIDAVVRDITRGKIKFDAKGALAKSGRAHASLVMEFLRHPYFSVKPPKSAGWEEFGDDYLKKFLPKLRRIGLKNAAATVTQATAIATADAYRRFVYPHGTPKEIVLAGGGAKNAFFRGLLQTYLSESRVTTSDDYGVPVDQLEAVAFALLALQTLLFRPNNEPAATGAKRPVICGQLAFP